MLWPKTKPSWILELPDWSICCQLFCNGWLVSVKRLLVAASSSCFGQKKQQEHITHLFISFLYWWGRSTATSSAHPIKVVLFMSVPTHHYRPVTPSWTCLNVVLLEKEGCSKWLILKQSYSNRDNRMCFTAQSFWTGTFTLTFFHWQDHFWACAGQGGAAGTGGGLTGEVQ